MKQLKLVLCGIAMVSFAVSAAAEKPLNAPPPSVLDLVEQVQALEARTAALEAEAESLRALATRVVGNKAYVTGGGNTSFLEGVASSQREIRFVVCGPDNLDGDGFCRSENPGALVVTTGLFSPVSERTVIRMDASNSPAFEEVAALLTNGLGTEFIAIEVQNFCPQPCGGGTTSGPESSRVLGDPVAISGGPDHVDFAGLEIKNISVVVDTYYDFYRESEDRTESKLEFRLFIGI